MMVDGEAEIDMASLDPKRFGGWMTTEYAARKNEEAYEHVFILHHPDEERPACRPLRVWFLERPPDARRQHVPRRGGKESL